MWIVDKYLLARLLAVFSDAVTLQHLKQVFPAFQVLTHGKGKLEMLELLLLQVRHATVVAFMALAIWLRYLGGLQIKGLGEGQKGQWHSQEQHINQETFSWSSRRHSQGCLSDQRPQQALIGSSRTLSPKWRSSHPMQQPTCRGLEK